MTILFAVAQLPRSEWNRLPFDRRVSLVREHYKIDSFPEMSTHQWFFEHSGIGVFVARQRMENKQFDHYSDRGNQVVFATHLPFGYKTIVPEASLTDVCARLADALAEDPSVAARINPPNAILRIDQDAESVEFWNDALGMGKTFLHDFAGGVSIASRPIAAHLLAASHPTLDDLGWASLHLHGWALTSLSPYADTRRLLGGAHLKIDARGVVEHRTNYAARWFTVPGERSTFEAFETFAEEFDTFTTASNMDIALSGGRDSRASAALATHFHPELGTFRTNDPPALEGIIARQLIERLPYFGRFAKEKMVALSKTGRPIWHSNKPRLVETEIHGRGAAWAYNEEGIAAHAAVNTPPRPNAVFQSNPVFRPSFSGVAGESAKAYYWSPRMTSGAYARDMDEFFKDIQTPIGQRMKTHVLTKQSAYPFLEPFFRSLMELPIAEAMEEAAAHGISGYQFLDYWWFTDRFGAGTTVAYAGTNTITPFTVPEYTAEALQKPVEDRARARFLHEIVIQYRPEWSAVPYFDEAQRTATREQLRFYRPQSLLWQDDLRGLFMEVLHDSPALGSPYNRKAILSFFENVPVPPAEYAGLNHKALGLVHRHHVYELCQDVARKIDAAIAARP